MYQIFSQHHLQYLYNIFSFNVNHKVIYFSITEKWDPGPIHGIRDPGPSTWDPSSRTLDPGSIGGAWNTAPLGGIQDLGPSTWDLLPAIRDPTCGNLDPIPLRGTGDPYLGTLKRKYSSLLMRSLVAQPSCFKQIAAKICTTWQKNRLRNWKHNSLFNFFAFFGTYLKITNWPRSRQFICNKGGLCY